MCGRAFAEAFHELREEHTSEGEKEWRRLSPVERFEWLEEHCWTLPPEERWDAMERHRTKIVGALKNRAWDLATRTCAPGHA
jgi:hypothetical protein